MVERVRERDACGIGFVADAGGRATHGLVATALEALRRVRHRGAVAADGVSGDGAGLLVPIPRSLFADAGLGMLFLPPDAATAGEAIAIVERSLRAESVDVLGWREVPVDPCALGPHAGRTRPAIAQVLLRRPWGAGAELDAALEAAAFRARRRIEREVRASGVSLYVASMSFATVTYKALCAADQLAAFYPDLTDPGFDAWFAVYHQRFSTNTAPSWERAQPFRMLCHNGEINTLGGNTAAMRSRRGRLGAPPGLSEGLLAPTLDEGGSDSAMLDEAAELLTRGGRELSHAMAMLVPPAWEHDPSVDPTLADFYRYHACLLEPWDGPAGLVFTDGHVVGARLDRGGLRPLRLVACDDGLVACGSEAGVVDVEGRGRVRRGRLGPGEMIVVDPAAGGLLEDFQISSDLASHRPYGVWLSMHLRRGTAGRPLEPGVDDTLRSDDLTRLQVAFGYTSEEVTGTLRQMGTQAKEPLSSMGDDTAEPPLANRPRLVFGFLKQRFAQVTNPPIDPLHERSMMSIRTLVGPRAPLLTERPDAASLVELPSFLLFPDGLHRLCHGPFVVARLDATFDVDEGPAGLDRVCRRIADEAERSVRRGAALLVVSDEAVGPLRAPVPSVLATGAVQQRLIGAGLRGRTALAVDTGEAREVHHVACLLGYGADVVVPRLALAALAALADEGRIGGDRPSPAEAQERFRRAIEDGVRKVMSKLGISTVEAYRGAQAFESIGLTDDVVDRCLNGTACVPGRIGFGALGEDAVARHRAAFGAPAPALANPGFVKHRTGGEFHATNPEVIDALHAAVGVGGAEPTGDAGFRRFAELVDGRPAAEPRDLLRPLPVGPPVPLRDVEPAAAIVRRFSAGAMSHGALSAEAHETIAEALASIGARANTGEGGEDRSRFRDPRRNSAIKQVASGRFGVTPEYLAFAEELQIKMAQGSKPGEGGQLPGHKVTAEIARLRHTAPGVGLISPPPHHDIYSIEDLAQLIFDLRQANPRADVSVKLVSTVGVGVIAAGVAKAMADIVHIAGADGGTGASPLSSIKNAGLPWEVGLAEARRMLVAGNLRERVRLRVDGGFKTGRDVLIAALLGADEYSFGTALLLAEGCIMVRACHRDTCPTGIATQREDLRGKFAGTPEQVAAYLVHVAEDVRRRLAALGLRSLDEAVGRTDLLATAPADGSRAGGFDVSGLLEAAEGSAAGPAAVGDREGVRPRAERSTLGDRVADDALPAIERGDAAALRYRITNGDRAVGARLGSEIARRFGVERPPGVARIRFDGQAGQSFGAFLADGVTFELIGEANDYVGKGMGGGTVVIRPPEDDAGDPVLAGNTVLYGATGGELFVAGRVGERLAVRGSGAVAVVEGAGQHACEYMTGGTVVIIGPVGRGVGAGMSGGEAFVFDPEGLLPAKIAPGPVDARRPSFEESDRLRALVERHAALTRSTNAGSILALWDRRRSDFWRVAPRLDVVRGDGVERVGDDPTAERMSGLTRSGTVLFG